METWNSTALLSTFDIAIICAVAYSGHIALKYRDTLRNLELQWGFALILAGLAIIALFYLADLFTMLVFPLFVGEQAARHYMTTLHLRYAWYTNLVSIGLIAIGLATLTHRMLPRLDELLRQLHEKTDQLDRAAGTDFLTALPNRRSFFNDLVEILSASRRSEDNFAILFIDLNDFKQVNDQHGHSVGDAILQQCADRISGSIRDHDLIARMGGDEFVIALTNLRHPDDAVSIAEKIIDTLEQPYHYHDHRFRIGATIGISHYPHDSRDIDLLISLADHAMYDAKKRSRNICVYKPDPYGT